MYLLYQTEIESSNITYRKIGQTHLFGRNKGIIPRALLGTLQPNQSEPYSWRIPRQQIISILNLNADEVVINAFPSSKDELPLYRIRDVFGYCFSGWTPILLHLDRLDVAINSKEFNLDNFNIDVNKVHEHIFATLYMRGSIKEGQLINTWNPPGRSTTNSTFMWPEVAKYFSSQIISILTA